MKDFRIFEHYKMKDSTKHSDYSKSLSTFQSFFHTDKEEEQELPIPQAGQKVQNTREEDQSNSGSRKSRKVTKNPSTSTRARAYDAAPPNKNSCAGVEPKDVEWRSRITSRTVELSEKA